MHNIALGGQYYNTGQVFQGLAVILFAGGLYIFYMKEKKWNWLLMIGQLLGFMVGVGLISNGIYSEDFMEAHVFWSIVLFLGIIISELLVNIALLHHPKFRKQFAYFGFIISIINTIWLLIDNVVPIPGLETIMEWIGVYTAEIRIALVGIDIFIREVWSKK